MRNLLLLSYILLFVCQGCTTKRASSSVIAGEENKSPSVSPSTEQKLSFEEANTQFAFKIFGKIDSSSKHDANILISPLSISYALSMTLNGANGGTGIAMKKVLGYQGYSNGEINLANSDLSKNLFREGTGVDISTANSIWSVNGIPVKQSFITVLNDYYSAESKSFSPNDPSVPSKINGWIGEKTDGMIKEMVDRLDPSVALMLINAVCFEGEWSSGFDEEASIDANFYLSTGGTKTVKMMEQTNEFKVFVGDNFSMVELVYGDGSYVMDVILPDTATGIDGFMPQFTAQSYSAWVEASAHRTTSVSLPRFKYGYKSELNDILIDMGMGMAFGGRADFSGISEGYPFAIDNVLHQAYIETTETGTKAAAATIVAVKTVALRPENPFIFKADHPFLFIIRETTSNTIIFMGKTVTP